MANYTMELRQIINRDIEIFDFDYPFYDVTKKPQFEEMFINHFFFHEIGCETVHRFKHYLKAKLHEIEPYYTHLYKTTMYEYNPILNYDVNEEITRELSEKSNGSLNNTSDISSKTTGSNTQYDTPIVSKDSYKKTPSFIDDSTNNNTSSGTSVETKTQNNDLNEKHTRKMSGNIGVMATQDLIMKEREVIININQMILNECNDLFMQVF